MGVNVGTGIMPRNSNGRPHSLAGMQVRDYFAGQAHTEYGVPIQPDAARAGYASRDDRGATLRDVYWGYQINAENIMHEALHIFTGKGDQALAAALGVDLSVKGSQGVSDALKAGGCGW